MSAIAEPLKPPKSPATPAAGDSDDDLCPRRSIAAAWATRERAAFFGDFQPDPHRLLRDFGADFSRPAAGAVGACGDRRSYETRGSQAPGGGGGDPPVRAAAGLSALNARNSGFGHEIPVHGWQTL